jgi:hypothetical protein
MAENKQPKKWHQKLWDGTGSGLVRRLLLYAIIINIVVILWPYKNNGGPSQLELIMAESQIVIELVGVGIISAIKENKKDE